MTKSATSYTDSTKRRRSRAAVLVLAPLLGLAPLGLGFGSASPAGAATRMPPVTVNPNAVNLAAGSTSNVVLTLGGNRPANFAWSLAGRPTGVSASLSCPTLRSCVLALKADNNVSDSVSLLRLVVRAGSSSRSLAIALHVRATTVVAPTTTVPSATTTTTSVPAPGASLALRPTNLITTVRPGTRATFPITVVRTPANNNPVSFTICVAPDGLACRVSAEPDARRVCRADRRLAGGSSQR